MHPQLLYSFTVVRDILHKNLNFNPWKPKSVQELFPGDMDRRLEFAVRCWSWLRGGMICYLRYYGAMRQCSISVAS